MIGKVMLMGMLVMIMMVMAVKMMMRLLVNCSPLAAVCVCVGSNAIKQSISDQPFTLIPTHYL